MTDFNTSPETTVPAKTLLVIGYVWPEPNSSAAGSRMLQLIQALQQGGYTVHYGSPAEFSEHATDLPALNIQPHKLALNCSSFDDFIQRLKPDAVMFDRFMMEEQFGWRVEKYCPQALRILDTEDLHCLRHARAAMIKADPQQPVIQPPAEFMHSELAVREIAAILRCDLSLMISEFEMDWLQSQFNVPATQLLYLPFMQAEKNTAQTVPDFSRRQHFISIGNFRHEPNWDAVRYLKESLWPAIRQQLPQAELHIYGAYPPPKATQLHNARQGFLVKGWADDAQQVVRSARVMLAPLRFGAGLKGKLIDAAECGTPAVTTAIGAEGMYSPGSEAALVANSAEDFIQQAVALYQDEAQWLRLQKNGLNLISSRFSFAEHAPRLQQRLAAIGKNIQAHRQQHFYSMMLRHHSLKSTQYMAQWIEAKNRIQ
ncbi:glycosyltransferase family 4 protein [Thalassolituus sp. ST750PaO-4]|uniref:glycosyltransferase family 4 protein n=1 Tax=Thalassolituus sp. ST750PaO-4 TaxID=2742965 RepID=UPI001CE2F2D0|nr:glycosyltransferase family 4 protein [Thalassolituus sp. ST750PaO-4]MCA6060365.1 glycosyltransferase family 4 protein [Thalassolituus sp. ST750PaO-4]